MRTNSLLIIIITLSPLFGQEMKDPCAEGGCGYLPESYEEISAVEESPANFVKHRGLPAKVDLSNRMPPIGSQGQQGSCVAWSTAYALKSYHEKIKNNWEWNAGDNDNNRCNAKATHIFSPAFVYNQINGGRDNGSSIYNALSLMVSEGFAPCNYMPYNVKDYRTQPSSRAKRAAAKYKAKDFKKLDMANLSALKSELAKGNPIVFGGKVYRELHKLRANNSVMDSYSGPISGGHAMVIVGYDDNLKTTSGKRGGFLIMNSWGTWWGKAGYAYISYRIWPDIAKYGYVVYDSDASLGPVSLDQDDDLNPPERVTASKGTLKNKVEVTWTAVKNAFVYEIQRSIAQKNKFAKLAYVTRTNYVDTTVQSGLAYQYRLIAISDKNNSDPELSPVAEGFSQTKADVAPTKVLDLSARSSVSGSRAVVNLKWSYPGQAKFDIIRFKKGDKDWKVIKKGTKDLSYTDKLRKPGDYYFMVRARVGKKSGPWSNTAKATIGGFNKPPSKVTNLKASNGTFSKKIELSWDKSAGAKSYFIWRYNPKLNQWDKSFETKKSKLIDDSPEIKSGEYFVYTVLARNAAGDSAYSEYAYGRGNPLVTRSAFSTQPPEELKAIINKNGKVKLSWESAKNADYYLVFRKTKTAEFEFIATVDSPKSSYEDTLPETGTIYFYTVRSQKELGPESQDSNIAAAVINDEIIQVRHRFIPGEGLDNFSGTWQGVIWDGRSKEKAISFQVIKNEGKPGKYKLSLNVNGKLISEAGEYATGSRVLITNNIRAEILDDKNEVLRVEYGKDFKGKNYFKEILRKGGGK